jgi:hypothetical protein
MAAKPVPQAVSIRAAMDQSAPLALLARRLQESRARFDCVQASLPPALRQQVRPGPVDEQGWSLLASNAAVAAKLRHLLPRLDQALVEAGWPALTLRVKIFTS